MARLEAVGLDVGGSGGGESACLMEAGLRETERQRHRWQQASIYCPNFKAGMVGENGCQILSNPTKVRHSPPVYYRYYYLLLLFFRNLFINLIGMENCPSLVFVLFILVFKTYLVTFKIILSMTF